MFNRSEYRSRAHLLKECIDSGGSAFVLWARGMRTDRTLTIQDRWTVRIAAFLCTITLLIMTLLLPLTNPSETPEGSQEKSTLFNRKCATRINLSATQNT